ncbi:transcriptional regulator [Pseudomonas sp. GM78]|uniref:MarR family winged helix-turn-helix transcriptional regulator n=1 Tax=Pseudomonas sp. GM78 TaxID=1144337 RepID=UPI0002707B1E|nr:MarR family winged helix-turn-helix transcriptional regulator [Pseudomonas sp. GM78]EJN17733.1 transcriptional regulator [Pseudomonas sp. GM78]
MKNSKSSLQDTDDASELGLLGEVACTNTALRRAARRLGNLYDEALAPVSLKATQIAMLAQISRFPGADGHAGPTLQELAGRLAIQMSAISHAMKPLVRDSIVELQQDALDKRTKHCVLTPKGEQLLADALVLWTAANERVEKVLGPSSAALLRQLADQIASDEFLTEFNHPTAE